MLRTAVAPGAAGQSVWILDELTLTLIRRIRVETERAAGGAPAAHSSEPVIDRLIDELGRAGRSSGAGCYDYADGKRTGLWPGLAEHFGKPGTEVPFEDLKERMLFAEALDTVRCFDEGVLRSVAEANVGSLLGIGFPAWTGGVIQYINGYEGGLPGFVARTEYLHTRYGERFAVPASLAVKAERGERFE